jgi:DUF4097 and DUF4098 domain-containing protein YvlB
MKRKIALILMSIFCLAMMASCLCACNIVFTQNYTTTNHVVDPYENIDIDVDVAEVIIKKANGEKYGVSCFESDKIYHTVKVENGTLKIYSANPSVSIINIGWVKSPSVTVYVPEQFNGNLTISTDTGAVVIEKGLTFGNIGIDADTGAIKCSANAQGVVDIDADTGAIHLENMNQVVAINIDCSTSAIKLDNINCSNLSVNTDTGLVELNDVIAKMLNIDTDTGSVKLNRSNGSDSIVINTDTGSVTGTILTSGRYFEVETDTGSVSVPESTYGGALVKITTNTGSINIKYC